MNDMDRITVNPRQCGGRPCVRGIRIRVTDVLDLLATGMTRDEVIEELPDLEPEEVDTCLRFAGHDNVLSAISTARARSNGERAASPELVPHRFGAPYGTELLNYPPCQIDVEKEQKL